jgi:DNA-binding GntR family transcriptional regulator
VPANEAQACWLKRFWGLQGRRMKTKSFTFDMQLEIEDYLLQEIESHRFQTDSKIPSENELSEQFGINRHTVRKAIERLSKLGQIYTVQGKGCFVSARPSTVIYPVIARGNFSDNLNRRGKNHRSVLLNWVKQAPTPEERRHLNLAAGELIYRLDILRFVDEIPLSIYISSLPEQLVPNLEIYLAEFSSLYKILREQYGLAPKSKYRIVEATYPSLHDLQYLNISEHVSILKITSLAELADGRAVEYVTSRMRGDRYKLQIKFG